MRLPTFATALALTALTGSAHAADLRDRLYDPAGGVMVVAHRACHAAAPSRGLMTAVPENSLAALERCIALGVDVVEIDVRRTQDGALVLMHDAKVDRTTTGKGKVSDLTLGELQDLRLEVDGAATGASPPTLSAFLRMARGRILVNLDIKEDGATVAQVARLVHDVGADDWVLFKARADLGATPIADQPLYRNLAFMPIVGGKGAPRAEQLGAITTAQASGLQAIPAVELDALKKDGFAAVRDAAHAAHVRVWTNSLAGKGVRGVPDTAGDSHALTDPDKAWGGLIAEGVNVVQTDHPAALLDYLNQHDLRGRASTSIAVANAGSPAPVLIGASSRSR
ncbi:glycerophosphodiester phosphodiesterase family protein [Caulobacter sp.]|uniref:glycerophosphodiester phosphodiesterase family protein n=1 Tax=Caulobacter sp. TaxID=78 RepID=UPI001B21C17B|nr:glycerophosphodiester phosphodiesterase family protein [Caulobacter sp.]MBO9543186.1 glycerophosphodiester phosphodiesterase family protein [Caulobacter sp.]